MPRIDELSRRVQNKLQASRSCVHGSVGFILLTQGFVALVDASAVPVLAEYSWYAHASNLYKKGRRNATPKIYAARTKYANGKYSRLYMHRYITGAEKGQIVGHLNEYSLDSRLQNFRVGNHLQNMAERGGIEVVVW